ncbi:unnamed protein product [Phytophthora fragariaefolia]|uniref:Unnamed protein product n=1 Tax=Phytophthora fragariaefolia TaxID=1490495 RepID=A0A9W7CL53_9STRA|nr:unnamed protein product [Phytophthora fragariaefolia]
MEYGFQSGLLVDDNREEASVDCGEKGQVPKGNDKDAELEHAVDKHLPRRKIITLAWRDTNDVRLSQINTSIELSQNTVEQSLASTSESEVELSQSAVTRAFDLSPTDLQDNAAAVGLQILSEASVWRGG